MKVTIQPTPERYNAPINGVTVPVRIWRGVSERGVPMDVYVLSIVADAGFDITPELPPYMKPSRDTFDVDTSKP